MSKPDELADAMLLLAKYGYDGGDPGRTEDGIPCPPALRRLLLRVLEEHGEDPPPALRRPTEPTGEEIRAAIRVFDAVFRFFRSFIAPAYPAPPVPNLGDQMSFCRFWELAADALHEAGPEGMGWPELAELLTPMPPLTDTAPGFRQILATLLERLELPVPPALRDDSLTTEEAWYPEYLKLLENTGEKKLSAERAGIERTTSWREEKRSAHFYRLSSAALRRFKKKSKK